MKPRISGALETYLEEIAAIEEESGVVRASQLADRVGCKRSSVTSALKRLAKKGLINYKSYHPITLTESGKNTIKWLTVYHDALADFLMNILTYPEEQAQEEACTLEHIMSIATIERIRVYLEFLRETNSPAALKKHSQNFQEFLQKKS